MDFIRPEIAAYCETYSDQEEGLLAQINRETHLKVLKPRMLSGAYQGTFLKMISQLVNPLNVLEIGTYVGYSAICLAQGLKPGGRVITIDNNEELENIIRENIRRSGLEQQVKFVLGDATIAIRRMKDVLFDLVFIDADKENYLHYYQLVFDQVRPGGCILADNVLWSGKVVDPSVTDADTKALQEFNAFVSKDERVEKIMLPIRDGVYLIRKKVKS
jgi:caffeoyl-CoA O-methyltransferase